MTADPTRVFGMSLRVLGAALVLLVLAAAPSGATEIQRVVSEKGIEAWLVEEHSVPLIAMQFAFVGGAREEPDGKAGLAKLVSSTLDEGAGDLDSRAFQGKLEELSIQLSFNAGRDAFYGTLKTLTRNKETAFDLMHLALNQPRFDEPAVERIRAQIITGLRQKKQDPGDIANETFFKLAFGNHPYGRPTDGTVETVSAITTDDLRAFADRMLTRDRLKVAVVGDIDAESLKQVLDDIFAPLPATGERVKIAQASIAPGPVRRIIDMNIPQAVIRFGHQGIARKDDDFIAAYIVNHILGGGSFSSRLYTEVREKRGLAYSVYTYLYPLDHAALMLGGVATQNERAAESLQIIEAELRRLAEEGPTAEELAHAKSYLTGSYALRFDTSDKIARQLLAIQLEDLGIDYINTRNARIEAVTIGDVKRVAGRLLEPGNLLTTVVGRPKGLEEIKPGG